MLNRRQFLINLFRGGILALLAIVSGTMIRRWGEAEDCRRSYACGSCNQAVNCTLPEAGMYRERQHTSNETGTKDGRNRR